VGGRSASRILHKGTSTDSRRLEECIRFRSPSHSRHLWLVPSFHVCYVQNALLCLLSALPVGTGGDSRGTQAVGTSVIQGQNTSQDLPYALQLHRFPE